MSQRKERAAASSDTNTTTSNTIQQLTQPFPYTWTTPSLEAWRRQVNQFVEKYLTSEEVERSEKADGASRELIRASYEAGLYAMNAPKEYGGTPPPGCVCPGPVSIWYEFILLDELARCGAHGLVTELIGNFGMLLPILQAFASEAMIEMILRPMVRAELFVSFAFSEPLTTSAIAKPSSTSASSSTPSASSKPSRGPRMRTTATRSADGKEFEISGEKIYISFGARSDYIVTACTIQPAPSNDNSNSTPPASSSALSLILVPSKSVGVTITPMDMTGWRSTSTTRISFNRARVPVNLLLVDGSNLSVSVMSLLFQLLQANINQERYVTAIIAHRSSRVCFEDALNFARKKSIGGKKQDHHLSDSPVVRQQLVQMSLMIQQNQALLESLTHQIALSDATNSSSSASSASAASSSAPHLPPRRPRSIAQQIALVKYGCTRELHHCAHTAATIVGGGALLVGSGSGGRIERLLRDSSVVATVGGNENILLEFVAKQSKL